MSTGENQFTIKMHLIHFKCVYLWSHSAFWVARGQRDGQQERFSRLQFFLRGRPCSERYPHSFEEASLALPRALHSKLYKNHLAFYMLAVTNTYFCCSFIKQNKKYLTSKGRNMMPNCCIHGDHPYQTFAVSSYAVSC